MSRLNKLQLNAIVAAVGLALLAFVLWTMALSPRIATAQDLKTQTEQVESANIALVKQHHEILTLADQAPQLATQAQALFSRMPQSAQLPAVFRQINAAAWRAGISSRNVQVINATIPESVDKATAGASAGSQPLPIAADIGVHLATMKVEVAVSGTDYQRQTFLSLLQGLDRGLLLTGTNVVSDGTTTNFGTMMVTGTMFVLQSQLPDLVANAQKVIEQAQRHASERP